MLIIVIWISPSSIISTNKFKNVCTVYTPCLKKGYCRNLAITSSNLGRFPKFFHCWKGNWIWNKSHNHSTFTSTRLKKNPQLRHIQEFNITQSCTVYVRCKWKRYYSTSYWYFHIFCSKCPPLAHTQARIRPRHSSTALSITPCSIPCQTSWQQRCFSSVTSWTRDW